MQVTAIIAAGGQGARVGSAQPKQFLTIGGQSILERSVRAFAQHPSVDEIVVALPREQAENPPEYLRTAPDPGPGKARAIRVVVGGARRQDSVTNAFRVVDPRCDVVVIHDAARPFVSADLISRTIASAAKNGAALAAIVSRDTVKRVDRMVVLETITRESVYLAQTPQAFRRDVLRDALAVGDDATDEAMLAERAGHPVHIVDGEPTNIKITTPQDFVIAEAMIAAQRRPPASGAPARTGRAGTGYDLHRLVEGRPLVVGGVTIPFERGPLGHSDGDVACHAATDAILGAAALGDIGRHFPDTDPRWKGASSLDLLTRAVAIVGEHGFVVGNIDVTVVLERPKIKDRIDEMRSAMAAAIGIDVERISIKGKTNEGMDAVGRGEAIAAHAIAQIRRQ